jgi:hypothetical protein
MSVMFTLRNITRYNATPSETTKPYLYTNPETAPLKTPLSWELQIRTGPVSPTQNSKKEYVVQAGLFVATSINNVYLQLINNMKDQNSKHPSYSIKAEQATINSKNIHSNNISTSP